MIMHLVTLGCLAGHRLIIVLIELDYFHGMSLQNNLGRYNFIMLNEYLLRNLLEF